jgi:hypothetical protein
MGATHLTIRLVRFAEAVELIDPPHGWAGTPLTTFVAADAREIGLTPGTPKGLVWISCALFADGAAARAAFESSPDATPWAGDAVESWLGLLQPFYAKGTTTWLDPSTPGPMFVAGDAPPPDHACAVITSAGWNFGPGLDRQRIVDFGVNSVAVRASMTSSPGLHSMQAFGEAPLSNGRDLITLTFWRDLASMQEFAYRKGTHRTIMDEDQKRTTALYDRSSFTRLRGLASRGSWRGTDPLSP